jgi:Leucine-rich repeat (LRR) protein
MCLKKLWIANNSVKVVKPLEKLMKIEELSLFNNQIFHSESSLEVFIGLPVLTILSIDGNPVSY